MVRGRIRQGQNSERTHPAWRGDSARLPFIIVSTFLVRGKNCLLKINSRCSRSNTKLMESVPLRDKNRLWGEQGVLFSRLLVTDVAVSVKTCTWPNVQHEHAAADRRQGSERGRRPVPPPPRVTCLCHRRSGVGRRLRGHHPGQRPCFPRTSLLKIRLSKPSRNRDSLRKPLDDVPPPGEHLCAHLFSPWTRISQTQRQHYLPLASSNVRRPGQASCQALLSPFKIQVPE